jgi:hypothetical protein
MWLRSWLSASFQCVGRAYDEIGKVYVWVNEFWFGGWIRTSGFGVHTLGPSGITSWQRSDWSSKPNIPNISAFHQSTYSNTHSLGILPSYRHSRDFSVLTLGARGAQAWRSSPGPFPYPPHCLIVFSNVDWSHYLSAMKKAVG